MRTFAKEKPINMKNKILSVSKSVERDQQTMIQTRQFTRIKKIFFQVLCHNLSGLCFICSRHIFLAVLCLLHTSWPVAFKFVLKDYPAIPENVKESSYYQFNPLIPFHHGPLYMRFLDSERNC